MNKMLPSLAALGLLTAAWTASAHHSLAVYDTDRQIVIEGVVTQLVWRNPHPFLFLEVQRGDGIVETWAAEMAPTSWMTRHGYDEDSITSGEKGWATYRCSLDGMLNDAGVVFAFPPAAPDPANFDIGDAEIEDLISDRYYFTNHMVGGQVGFRWLKRLNRWNLQTEWRAMGFHNFQQLHHML